MIVCEECGEEFEKIQQKANHVRWTHKVANFTKDGKKKSLSALAKGNYTRRGYTEHAEFVIETKSCPRCEVLFEVKIAKNRSGFTKTFCSRKCANVRQHSDETKARIGAGCKDAHKDLVKGPKMRAGFQKNKRFSSKSERELAKMLGSDFSRQHNVKLDSGRLIAVDIKHNTKNVWIESDGLFHFQKMYGTHDIEKSVTRDNEQGLHCEANGILLVRVKNFAYSIEEQISFIEQCISTWNGTGKIECLY